MAESVSLLPKLLTVSELLEEQSKEQVIQLFCQLLNSFLGPCLRPGKTQFLSTSKLLIIRFE